MKIENLIGTWQLQSLESGENDHDVKPVDDNVHGILIYNTNGYMSVAINGDAKMLFYTGTYKMPDEHTVVHSVMNASELERIGKDMVREAALTGDILTLIDRRKANLFRLKWKRTVKN